MLLHSQLVKGLFFNSVLFICTLWVKRVCDTLIGNIEKKIISAIYSRECQRLSAFTSKHKHMHLPVAEYNKAFKDQGVTEEKSKQFASYQLWQSVSH